MSKLSDYLEQELLDHLFNGDALATPDTYLALYTSDPTDANTGTEVSGGSYARVRIYANGGGPPDWTLAAADAPGYSVANDDDITFPTATGDWGTVTHFGILDASTGGNLLYHGALDDSQLVVTGGIFKILAGDLVLGLQ